MRPKCWGRSRRELPASWRSRRLSRSCSSGCGESTRRSSMQRRSRASRPRTRALSLDSICGWRNRDGDPPAASSLRPSRASRRMTMHDAPAASPRAARAGGHPRDPEAIAAALAPPAFPGKRDSHPSAARARASPARTAQPVRRSIPARRARLLAHRRAGLRGRGRCARRHAVRHRGDVHDRPLRGAARDTLSWPAAWTCVAFVTCEAGGELDRLACCGAVPPRLDAAQVSATVHLVGCTAVWGGFCGPISDS
jgi:hypothetical protein